VLPSATDVRAAPARVGSDGADPRRWHALVVTQLAAFMALLDSNPYYELALIASKAACAAKAASGLPVRCGVLD
jgi:hypothetical protein